MDDEYILVAKYLFNPSLTTIWDLKRLLEREGKVYELILKLMEPIIEVGDDPKERKVTQKGVENFLKVTEELLDYFINRNHLTEAKLIFMRHFSILNYLLNSYIVWNFGLDRELEAFFGKGNFEGGALGKIIDSLRNGFWSELAERIQIKPYMYLFIASQITSLEIFLKSNSNIEKERLISFVEEAGLKDFLVSFEPLREIASRAEEHAFILKASRFTLANLILFTSLIEKPLLLSRDIISELNSLARELLKKSMEIEEKNYVEPDKILARALKLLSKWEDNDILNELERLGYDILKLRIEKVFDPKLIPLLLPVDAYSLPLVAPRSFEVNFIDVFNPSNLLKIQQDIMNSLLSYGFPIEATFKHLILTKIKREGSKLFSIISSNTAYIPLAAIIGWPEVQLLESLLIMINEREKTSFDKEKAEAILGTLNYILEEHLKLAKEVIEKHIEEKIKKLVGYYTGRTTIFLTARLNSPIIRERIQNLENGKKLMELLDELSKLNEDIFGKPVKEPEVSDLFT